MMAISKHRDIMKNATFIIVLFFVVTSSAAQPVVGLWGVSSVKVGDRTMTPVAKWFKNNSDGTFQSGNGWTQNSIGTWTYDEKTREFNPIATNGVRDEYGAFTVASFGDSLTLERQEDGMKVIVSLVRIDEMPAAPADQICGLWLLAKVEDLDGNLKGDFDPGQRQFIHIRPDRRYRLRNPDESVALGIWYMNGHKPEFTLINDDREIDNLVFTVAFDQEMLLMKALGGQGLVYYYSRINEFPK